MTVKQPVTMREAYALLRQARDDGNENTDSLDPVLAWRAAMAITILWNKYGDRTITIESAGRTLSEQVRLWNGYRSGESGFNTAANPYRILGNTPVGLIKGSWHMIQANGKSYAIDFTRPRSRITWAQVHKVFDEVGLWHGIPDEDWHAQAVLSDGWIKGPLPPTLTSPQPPSIKSTPGRKEKNMIYVIFTGFVPHCWIDVHGSLRYVAASTVFDGVKSGDRVLSPPWKDSHAVQACTVGQLASLRNTARLLGVLEDKGAKTATFRGKPVGALIPKDFWDRCPYTEMRSRV